MSMKRNFESDESEQRRDFYQSGDILRKCKKLQSLLESFMLQSISSMDGANESFYHGMVLGLCAILETGTRFVPIENRGLADLIFN